jgi:hypothetical protein
VGEGPQRRKGYRSRKEKESRDEERARADVHRSPRGPCHGSCICVCPRAYLGAGARAVVATDEASVATAVLVASIITPLLGLRV